MYLASADSQRAKRTAVGVYERSGLSGYQVAPGSLPNNNTQITGPQGKGFPVQWDVSLLRSIFESSPFS